MTARQVTDIEGIPMSALLAEARRPRAVIVALHGGAATSAYFDAPNHPRLSFLRTGAALGFTVIALDRPGYGSSATHASELGSVARRSISPTPPWAGSFAVGMRAGPRGGRVHRLGPAGRCPGTGPANGRLKWGTPRLSRCCWCGRSSASP